MFYESVHIATDSEPPACGLKYRSFSHGWYTCVSDLSKPGFEPYVFFRRLSKMIEEPIFYFVVSDEKLLCLIVFRNGKTAARYSDDEFTENKKIYDIPVLAGVAEGQKRRFSSILGCADLSRRIKLLEEYFGVCFFSEDGFGGEAQKYKREKVDTEYRKYCEFEKTFTGKNACFAMKLAATYDGKLYDKYFGESVRTLKEHYFYYDRAEKNAYENGFTPVRFTGTELANAENEDYLLTKSELYKADTRFDLQYGGDGKMLRATFSAECPEAFSGKTLKLPCGYTPYKFLPSGELLLFGEKRIGIMDAEGNLLARQAIKGDIADLAGEYILTASWDSFFGYEYNENAKIHIYQIVRNK